MSLERLYTYIRLILINDLINDIIEIEQANLSYRPYY